MILELAVICGVEPWPYSARDLTFMHGVRQREDWNHTAAIKQEIHNSAFGRKRALSFDRFHPYLNRLALKPRMNHKQTTRNLDAAFKVWRDGK